MTQAHLHGGPLDGAVREVPLDNGGQPPEQTEFEHRDRQGTWYVRYQRVGEDQMGWHYQATPISERADEE